MILWNEALTTLVKSSTRYLSQSGVSVFPARMDAGQESPEPARGRPYATRTLDASLLASQKANLTDAACDVYYLFVANAR